MPIIRLRAPAGATSFKHDRDTYEVQSGYIEVPSAAVAAEAKSHGYSDETDPRASSVDGVVIPRADFFAGLKHLGIMVAEGLPADKVIEAFREGCARQAERLDFELKAADRRHAERLDQEVAAAEQRGEDKAITTLTAAKDAEIAAAAPKTAAGEKPAPAKTA